MKFDTEERPAGRPPRPPPLVATATWDTWRRYAVYELLREFVRERDRLGLEVWDYGVRLNARVDLISAWTRSVHMIHVTSDDARLWRWRRAVRE